MKMLRKNWGGILVLSLGLIMAKGSFAAELKRDTIFNISEFSSHKSPYSPAQLVNTDSRQITLFHNLSEWGLGSPTHLAFSTKGGVKVFSGDAIKTEEVLTESWLLVWFQGGEGWDKIRFRPYVLPGFDPRWNQYVPPEWQKPSPTPSFDIPYLISLQHKPDLIRKDKDGLTIRFSSKCGFLSLMPLYGILRIPQDETSKWHNSLPQDVIERCRFWNKALKNFPTYCQEDFAIDRANDKIIIRQTFESIEIDDDWGTEKVIFSPVAPRVGLAYEFGFPVEFSHPVIDTELATLSGPLYIILGTDSYTYTMKGLLKYVNELPEIIDPKDQGGFSIEKLKGEIEAIMRENLYEPYLKTGRFPFDKKWNFEGQFITNNLALLAKSLPYLSEEFKQELKPIIIKHFREDSLNPKNFYYILDPRTMREYLAGKTSQGGVALVDCTNITGGQVYNIWSIAHFLNSPDILKERWSTIKKFFRIAYKRGTWTAAGVAEMVDMFQSVDGAFGFARMAAMINDEKSYNFGAYLAGKYLMARYILQPGYWEWVKKIGQWNQPLMLDDAMLKWSGEGVVGSFVPSNHLAVLGFHHFNYGWLDDSFRRFEADFPFIANRIKYDLEVLYPKHLPEWWVNQGYGSPHRIFLEQSMILKKKPAELFKYYTHIIPKDPKYGHWDRAMHSLMECITSCGERSWKKIDIPFKPKVSFQRGVDFHMEDDETIGTTFDRSDLAANYFLVANIVYGGKTWPILTWHDYLPPQPGSYAFTADSLPLGMITPALDQKPQETRITNFTWGTETYEAKTGIVRNPYALALDEERDLLYVTGRASNTVAILDTKEYKLQSVIHVGKSPTSIVIHPKLDKVYVGCMKSGGVWVIDRKENKVIGRVTLGDPVEIKSILQTEAAYYLSLNPNKNELYVTDSVGDKVYVIDCKDNRLKDEIILKPNLGAIGFNTKTNTIYVIALSTHAYGAHTQKVLDTLYMIDGDTHKVKSQIKLFGQCQALAVDSERDLVYLCTNRIWHDYMMILDGKTNNALAMVVTINVPAGTHWGTRPPGITIDSQTGYAYVTGAGTDVISVYDPAKVTDKLKEVSQKGFAEMQEGVDTVYNELLKLGHLPVVARFGVQARGPAGIVRSGKTGKVYVANVEGTTISIVEDIKTERIRIIE